MGRTIVERAAQRDRVLLTLPGGAQCNYHKDAAHRVGMALVALSESVGGGISHYAIDDYPPGAWTYDVNPSPMGSVVLPDPPWPNAIPRPPTPAPTDGIVYKYPTGARVPPGAKHLHTVVEERPDKERLVWHYFLVPERVAS